MRSDFEVVELEAVAAQIELDVLRQRGVPGRQDEPVAADPRAVAGSRRMTRWNSRYAAGARLIAVPGMTVAHLLDRICRQDARSIDRALRRWDPSAVSDIEAMTFLVLGARLIEDRRRRRGGSCRHTAVDIIGTVPRRPCDSRCEAEGTRRARSACQCDGDLSDAPRLGSTVQVWRTGSLRAGCARALARQSSTPVSLGRGAQDTQIEDPDRARQPLAAGTPSARAQGEGVRRADQAACARTAAGDDRAGDDPRPAARLFPNLGSCSRHSSAAH